MDGLLCNSEDLYKKAIQQMGEKRGKVFTNELHRAIMGRSSEESVGLIKSNWEINDDLSELIKERDQKVIEIAETEIEIMPGVQEIMTFCLDNHIPHAIVTGSSRQVAEAMVKCSNLLNGFKFILTGNEVEHGKPAPDIYLKAAEMIGVAPEDCLVFEDSLNGAESAKAAGCVVAACPNRFSDTKSFQEFDVVLETLIDFEKEMKKLF